LPNIKYFLEGIKEKLVIRMDGNEYDINIAKHKKKKMIQFFVVLGIIVVAAVAYYIYTNTVKYDDFGELEAVDIDDGAGSQYQPFGDFFIKYGVDGISYIDGDETIWSQSYEMSNPMVDVCEEYVAVADKNTNTIYIYDEDGSAGRVTTSYPIIKIEVANQGVVAALLEEDKANYIEAYDKDGTALISHKTIINGNGYPLSFSLSNDGTKMIVSYLCVSTGEMESKVLFYNFSGVGQNEVDRMVGGFNHYNASVIPLVEFLNNDTAVAFGDDIISIYKMREKPTLEEELEFDQEINKIFYNEDYIGVVFEDTNGENMYRVNVYDTDGDLVMDQSVDMDFETIKFSGKNILIYNDLSCKIISFSGRTRFDYRFQETIIDIMPTDSFREYLVVTNTKVRKIKLK